jgi:hypothetical protein
MSFHRAVAAGDFLVSAKFPAPQSQPRGLCKYLVLTSAILVRAVYELLPIELFLHRARPALCIVLIVPGSRLLAVPARLVGLKQEARLSSRASDVDSNSNAVMPFVDSHV